MTYLILRFSTIGNVAMSVPVLHSLSARYPEHKFVLVSRKQLAPMFYGLKNIDFVSIDLAGEHKGIKGIWKLYKQLTACYKIDAVIDLQDIFGTFLLRKCFQISGLKVSVIESERIRNKQLTRYGAEKIGPIKSMFERYAETFKKAGLETDTNFVSIPEDAEANAQIETLFGDKTGTWIGIAPFAKFRSNMLPFRTTKEIIAYFANNPNTRVFLFGAGEVESEMLLQWAEVFGNVTCVAGVLPLSGELALMRKIDVMICMDSANKHLSALIGQSAISIWGGTHPHAGFYAWKQLPENMLQLNLSCRPCTINGSKKCKYNDFACIKNITASEVIEKVERKIKKQRQTVL